MPQTTAGRPLRSGGTAPPRTSPHRWWILAVIGIAQLMVVLDATVVNIALPSIQGDLGFTDSNRQWIVTSYSLAFGSLLLLGGRLADLIGRKAVFMVGVAGFASASALAGAAWNFEILVAGRALQGLSGAMLAPAALSLLNTTFTDAKERAKAFGVYGAITGAGGATGLLLGGLLTESLNWRWTLYINLVFAVIALTAGWILLGRSARTSRTRLDLPGTALVCAGLFALVYGFSNADIHGWSSPAAWGFLADGAALLAVFTWWQTRAAAPLLPLRILLDRNRGASFAAVAVCGAGMFCAFLFLTLYLQNILRYSPVTTGLAFLPMVCGLMVSAQLSSRTLLPRLGPKSVVPLGMGMAAVGMVWMTDLGLSSTYAADVLPPLLLIGLGLGLVMPAAMSLATDRVAAEDAGVASAAVSTMQQIGGAIGTALLNTLAASARTHYLAGEPPTPERAVQAQLHGFSTAYWCAAGIFTAGLVATGLLYRKGPVSHDPDVPAAVHT
ncbi:DHA2 family efflux MFS transporter permease subunit [Streptomyces sp. NBC_00322]|uniref:MFS transporter n=1 Tax=Streptomyces sp. NBC_00322 TaxID=2975712 RepID=UPI002E2AA287|nr:DHA2 family efflux MFS transporter permease subunit [Streptomyces sp. NBC_00322]